MSDSFVNPTDTTISCDQLSNFINEVWMDVTRAESVQEIEIKIDLLEKNFGKSLAPCVGYEVLNNKTEDYDSVTRILSALKKDSKERVRNLAREGAHYEGSDEKMTTNQLDLLNSHIDQIGKDVKDRCGVGKGPSMKELKKIYKKHAPGWSPATSKTVAKKIMSDIAQYKDGTEVIPPKIHPENYVIYSEDEGGYWSDDIGWVDDSESATWFDKSRKETRNLPTGGQWRHIKREPQKKVDDQFDPGSNQYEHTSTDQYE